MSDPKSKPSKEIQLRLEQTEEGYVLLPFNQEGFKDFIKSLLGSPQTISKTISGSFEIEVSDIRNLHQLIYQRVTQQNEGVLIQFKSKIVFSDNSSVELNSLQELLTYNEVRPVTSRAVHLVWDFVVRFQDKAAPEKQRIQISLVSSGEMRPEIFDELPLFATRIISVSGGFINIRIEHTARTWGADIEALLNNHFQSLLKTESGFKKFVRKHSGKIAITVFVLLFLSVVTGIIIDITKLTQEKIALLEQLYQDTQTIDLQALSVQLEFIARNIASGESVSITFYGLLFTILGLIAAILIAIWIEDAASNVEPSFILLTKQARKDKEITLARLQRKWLSFFAALVVSILTGLLSNYIFNILFLK